MMWGQVQVWGKYPFVFLAGVVVTMLLTPLWCRVARRFGFVDAPDARRIHEGVIPSAGGIAMFAGFHAACAMIYWLPWLPFSGQLSVVWWLSFISISSCVVALGLLDDRFQLKPRAKLAGQVVVAMVAYLLGVRLGNAFGTPLPMILDLVGTVLWFLILMNAFNLIDGMDGLAAGLGIVAAAGIGISLMFRHHPCDVLVCLALAGVCLGFLRYNFHPASVFMGDTGSMFIGCTIAAVALSTSSKGTAMASIGVPILAVGVPLLDAGLAVWRRTVRSWIREGSASVPLRMLAKGDSEHLHHRLIRSGLSQRQVAVGLYVFGCVLSGVGIVSAVYREYAVGTMLVAFLVGTYVVVRHLAWIELWDSGSAVLQGFNRPNLKSRAVFVYPVVDVVAMAFSLALAMGLTEPGAAKHAWMHAAPFAIGFPFVLLVLSRSYSRVWSAARVSEYALTGGAVVAGILLWLGGRLVVDNHLLRHQVVVALLYLGTSVTLVVGARAVVRIVQDLMAWRSRWGAGKNRGRRTLIVGAGPECLLFLKEYSVLYDRAEHIAIVGLVDEDPSLRGRWVHGYRVLGGVDCLAAVIKVLGAREIVITGKLDSGQVARILAIAGAQGIVVRQWMTSLQTLS